MSALEDAIAELSENTAQLTAFNEDGHCAVLAPPGSGKTKLLTTKLANTLIRGAIRPPRGAACITMTNEAVLELRRRLRALGVPRRPNLFVGTVHAFALSRIVGPFAAPAGRSTLARSRLATDREVNEAFETAFNDMGFRPYERGEIKTTTEKARQRLDLTGNRLLGGPRVAEMARVMQQQLEARELYDFHDLIRHAVSLIQEHEWIRRVLGATHPRIYVDEYQDLAPGLDRIVRAVTLESDSDAILFAVGDPDQAIYAFSGAHPELLRELAAEPDVTLVELDQNYRCASGIIDMSLQVLGEERRITGERAGGSVQLHAVTGGEPAQASKAVELVKASLAAGVPHDQIAVIASWGIDRDLCASELREARIPVYARLDDHWKTTSLTMLLEIMASWGAHRDASGIELHELVEAFRATVPAAREHGVLKDVTRTLLGGQPDAPADEFIEELAAAALGTFTDDPTRNDDSRQLERMRGALSDGPAAGMELAELGARARAPGHVMASTIHGAKGLEFDVAIIVGVDEVCMPGFNPTAEERAESRRKFYVSVTRARDIVHLVHTDRRISKRTGRPYDVSPSPFIAPLALRR